MIVPDLIRMDKDTIQRFKDSLGKGVNNLNVRYLGKEIKITGISAIEIPTEYIVPFTPFSQLILGDAATELKKLLASSIDLTVTSPPYDNLRNYNGYDFDFETIARELYRVTKSGGVVVWIVMDQTKNGSETGTSFRQALFFKECGFNIHDTMIYASEKPPLTHNRYEQKFEYMFILSKGKPKTFNPIMEPCKRPGAPAGVRTFRQNEEGILTDSNKDNKIANEKIK